MYHKKDCVIIFDFHVSKPIGHFFQLMSRTDLDFQTLDIL